MYYYSFFPIYLLQRKFDLKCSQIKHGENADKNNKSNNNENSQQKNYKEKNINNNNGSGTHTVVLEIF